MRTGNQNALASQICHFSYKKNYDPPRTVEVCQGLCLDNRVLTLERNPASAVLCPLCKETHGVLGH